jgi:hypothetical protein
MTSRLTAPRNPWRTRAFAVTLLFASLFAIGTLAAGGCGGKLGGGDAGGGGNPNGNGPTTQTCASVCTKIPLCGSAPSDCVSGCTQAQQQCAAAGHLADFDALLDCIAGATATCQNGGPQLNGNACVTEEQVVTNECAPTTVTPPSSGSAGPPPVPVADAGAP